jgi:ankyrin repeat protein
VQDNIGSWLCEEMREEGVEIDQLDMAANTPLHLAARGGRTAMAATLLHLGASVHMKVLFFDESLKVDGNEKRGGSGKRQ